MRLRDAAPHVVPARALSCGQCEAPGRPLQIDDRHPLQDPDQPCRRSLGFVQGTPSGASAEPCGERAAVGHDVERVEAALERATAEMTLGGDEENRRRHEEGDGRQR